ncbi:unnamed protein product [Blepharisma stoltei]|uniref:SAM domain-containing protein n=1 Tax=Blepharisma stoltei TaxID=1481888 RepID=A0AAU9KFZ0_9CILI|nr:unnamed protein product [Blepharisma stoltei]
MIQYNIASISTRSTGSGLKIHDLQMACRLGDLDAIREAYRANPDSINIKDDSLGWTPLYRTIISGSINAAEFLLKRNANPNIKNNLGETPLHQTADNSQYGLAELLLKYKADPNIQQNDGDTPLHHAAYRGDTKMVEILLKNDSDPNIPNFMFGRTPLHYAADNNYLETMKTLLEFGGDLYYSDKQGKTPIDLIDDKTSANFLKNIWIRNRKTNEDIRPVLNSDVGIEPECEVSEIRKEEKPLYIWLEKYNLQDMYDKLCEAGFDDLENIASQMQSSLPLKIDDLKRIGIAKIGYIYKFLLNINHDSSSITTHSSLFKSSTHFHPCGCCSTKKNTEKKKKVPTLKVWLESLNLSELKDKFEEAGFEDFETIIRLMNSKYPVTDSLLEEIGIQKLGHRIRILANLQDAENTKELNSSFIIDRTSNKTSCEKCILM